MAVPVCVKELAHRVWTTAAHEIGGMHSRAEVGGVPVTFPYQNVEQLPPYEPMPPGVIQSYLAMRELHEPGAMPPEWVTFIQDIGAMRAGRECNYPVDLVHAAYFVIEDHPDVAREAGIPPFATLPEHDGGGPDFRDGVKVREVIDAMLGSPRLHELLARTLECLLPDLSSGAFLDRERATTVILELGIPNGTLVDIGCGMGDNTVQWREQTGLNTIGIDRQFHRRWYEPYWRTNQSGAEFTQADIAESLPMATQSVDVVVYENVVPHQTERGVAQTLEQVQRVLRDDGLLAIGPQHDEESDEHGGWMFLRKESGTLKKMLQRR